MLESATGLFSRKYGFQPWLVEFAGEGDIELLDYALRDFGAGEIQRVRRLLNVKRLENVVITLNGRTFQPFRAEFAKNRSGNYVIDCRSGEMADYAAMMVRQMGFRVCSTVEGEAPYSGLLPGCRITLNVSLNGRSKTFDLST